MKSDDKKALTLLIIILGAGTLMKTCQEAGNSQEGTAPSSVYGYTAQDTNNTNSQLRTCDKELGEDLQSLGNLDPIDYSAIEEEYLEQMEVDPEEYEDYDEFEHEYLNRNVMD